ncbi:MAG: hypothetical protein JW937_08230 [Candidatus Omnitrophica bacterium]|nr:hypothetical protein [Candidatus Omnitrophota bacterium]
MMFQPESTLDWTRAEAKASAPDRPQSQDFSVRTRVAVSKAEHESATSLFLRLYQKKGYLGHNALEVCQNLLNYKPQLVYVAEAHQQTIGTVRLLAPGPQPLPMESVFAKEVGNLRRQGRAVCEIAALGVNRDFSWQRVDHASMNNRVLTIFALFRALIRTALKLGMDDMCVAVHPRHAKLYTSILFTRLGSTRPYGRVNDHPAMGLRLNLTTLMDDLRKPGSSPYAEYIHNLLVGRPDSA